MPVSREVSVIYQALTGRPTREGSKIREAFKGIPLDFIKRLGSGKFAGIVEGQFSSEYGRQLREAFSQVSGLVTDPAAAPSPTALPVQPGLTQRMEQERIDLEKYIADLQNQIDQALVDVQEGQLAIAEQAAEQTRILSEAQLAANPADFVAYELYKRKIQEEGFDPTSAPRSDVEIQDLFSLALGLPEGEGALGTGRFGVDIPRTGEISRSELGAFSPTDIGLLTSFLGAGVETEPGEFQGINPADYFTELEEGFIPVLSGAGGRTQVRF